MFWGYFWPIYSGVCNNHMLCIYLFPRKILSSAFNSPSMNSAMTSLCVYLFFLKNTQPCALFHTCDYYLNTPDISLFSEIRCNLSYLYLPTYLKIWRYMWMLPCQKYAQVIKTIILWKGNILRERNWGSWLFLFWGSIKENKSWWFFFDVQNWY